MAGDARRWGKRHSPGLGPPCARLLLRAGRGSASGASSGEHRGVYLAKLSRVLGAFDDADSVAMCGGSFMDSRDIDNRKQSMAGAKIGDDDDDAPFHHGWQYWRILAP